MKAIIFKRAQKHLNYFNNLNKICSCFGIDYSKYQTILTLDNGRDWLLDTFEEIDSYEAMISNVIDKAKSHKKVKELQNFKSGYSMGEYTSVLITSEFKGLKFENRVMIEDNRAYYSGRKSYSATHGFKIAVFKLNDNGTLRFVRFEEKVK